MSGVLVSSTTSAPGFLGLNTQDSSVTLESGYATTAYNCIIDKFGRLGSRRGFIPITTNRGTLTSTAPINSIFEFKSIEGVITYLSAGDGKLFEGTSTLTEKKIRNVADTADVAVTFANNNWDIVALSNGSGAGSKGEAFLVSNGNPMLVYTKPSASYIFNRVADKGAVPTGYSVTTFDPNCALAAFGRVWVAGVSNNKTTVFFSQQLNGSMFTGVGSGLLDISSVIGGNDEIVGIAAHNKFLVIFCKNNIVIYQGAADPTSMVLADLVSGVGCLGRDTISPSGDDLIFLSKTGLRSLQRTTQQNSMPLTELSLNIRDDLISMVGGEVASGLKSIYFERDAFYLLMLPVLKQVVCFDMRQNLPNGASRVTIWTNNIFYAFCTTEDRKLLLGGIGGINNYFGYTDNGVSYRMEYFTPPADLGKPTTLKFLKKMSPIVIGSASQNFVVKYSYDYRNNYTSRVTLNNLVTTNAEYHTTEYGIGEYTGGLVINSFSVHMGGSGKVFQLGIESEIVGSPVSIQKADIYLKTGRTA